MRYWLMSGTGNRFVMLDGFSDAPPADPAALARAWCDPAARRGASAVVGPLPDGLILLRPPSRGGDCAMEVYNADGSRPETCGNGLRCTAKLAFERGRVSGETFTIETDAGLCPVRVERDRGRVVGASVGMGRPRALAEEVEIGLPSGAVRGTIADMGNPHFVLIVDDEREARVAEWGPAIERDPRFPAGTNVEFLSKRSGGLHLRVWERGVGETRACGSGACAAAAVAVRRGLAGWPVEIHLPGGVLEVDCDDSGSLTLSGAVEELPTDEWSPTPAAGLR